VATPQIFTIFQKKTTTEYLVKNYDGMIKIRQQWILEEVGIQYDK